MWNLINKFIQIKIFSLLLVVMSMTYAQPHPQAVDPLPSWNNGKAKQAILDFVQTTTDKTNPNYLPLEERIATFDQDGTVWVEQPMYTQLIFAFDRIFALAPQHPEWKTTEPFKSILNHDQSAMAKFNEVDLEKIVLATHAGMTIEAFAKTVRNWLATAKDPRWHRSYTQLIYQPMLEVLNYLRANGYKTYIVTGGGQDFVRVYADQVYGIPSEQIIGSALQTQYHYDKQKQGMLIKTSKLLLNNNYAGKPEDIYLFIGKQPAAAFGNSTGDQQMLEYTQTGHPRHLMMLVHHDDAKREYRYRPNSKIGTFSAALMKEAQQNGWIIISMQRDWKRIFPFEKLNSE